MSFAQLFQIGAPAEEAKPASRGKKGPAQPRKARAEAERGCNVCPLDKVPGIKKILGTVEPEKKILVVAQSPGPEENEAGRELIGRSGKFFWAEMKKAGMLRQHCSVQNVVRCFPADEDENGWLRMRSPTPEEIRCCSIHTENALSHSRAQHILVLGQVAAKALLKTRSLPQQKIFYSEPLKARVYLIDHPAFFIRAGANNETDSSQNSRLKAMRGVLALLSQSLEGDTDLSDQFSYLRQQKYRLVDTAKKARQAQAILRHYAAKGHCIAADIENDPEGTVTCCGFSPQPGLSLVFLFDPQLCRDSQAVYLAARELLEDPAISKAFHWGPSDFYKLQDAGIRVQGYSFDTLFSEYFAHPDQKKYGLEEIVELRLPEFSGYKSLAYSDLLRGVSDVPQSVLAGNSRIHGAYIKKHGLFDVRQFSAETYRLYNGADADVTQRIIRLNRDAAPDALMQLYIRIGKVLYRMESNGPHFDFEHNQKLALIYPHKEKKLLARLREIAEDESYNPASPPQVGKILWGKLGLKFPGTGKPNTRKNTLLLLSEQHEFPGLQLEVRRVQKASGTYIAGYRECAQINRGRMRTKWKAWGTATGRLSSGGGKDDPGCVNLQNIPKDPQMRNMLSADPNWRQAYEGLTSVAAKFLDLKGRIGHAAECGRAMLDWVGHNLPELHTFLGFDFGQIEVRVAAQITGDQNLIHDCLDADIHSTVGATMTGWSIEKIKKDKRTRTLTKNCIAKGQRVLTNAGLVPIQDVTLQMLVWDGIEFVTHDGIICQGVREVITHDGLRATPDHEVYLQCGVRALFGHAKAKGLLLGIGGIEEASVRYAYDSRDRVEAPSDSFREIPGKKVFEEVYDLANAGPRHRFTVEGKIVGNCHFGILFGQSEDGTVNYVRAVSSPEDRAKITDEQIRQAYRRYFQRYFRVKEWTAEQREFAREHKYCETLFGLRRQLDIREDRREEEYDADDDEPGRSSYWANICLNSPVQGSAHQVMLCALSNLETKPKKYRILGIPMLEIHDYLGFSVKVLEIVEAYRRAKYLLEKESLKTIARDFPRINWKVPLAVEGEAGLRLGDQVEVGDDLDPGRFLVEWWLKCREHEEQLEKELLSLNSTSIA